MKYLVLFLIIGVVLYVMSRKRSAPPATPRPPRAGRAPQLEGMVACGHCGLHLPRSEALPGPDGAVYCSAAHRDAGPRA
ncbi:PP0621 family protein [uncultured Aquincola sp.]|uniref:PP0621 family protein n=1 Tax=uncultured Aquincola sp. TaxID=886556 RepID=UPI0032B1701D|tara:strand:- start:55 stop:291 length:237 start_codon:yes stop_codon:yes gene_type:complete